MTARSSVLDERYGRTAQRRRRGRMSAVAGAVVLAAAALAWGVWTGVGGATTALDVDTLASDVTDDGTTTVRWLVTGRADTELVCAVEARDRTGAVVGLVEQRVAPSGRTDRSGTTTVRTVRRAAAGLIVSCRDA